MKDVPRTFALELKYLYGGISYYHAGEILGPRRLPDYELFFMLEGTAIYTVNRHKYVATPGTLIMPRPGFVETIKWSSSPRTRLSYLHFDIARLPSDWPAPQRWPVLIQEPPAVVSPLLHCVVRQLSCGIKDPLMPPTPHVTRLLESLIGEVLLDSETVPVANPELARSEPVERAIHRMRQVFNRQPPRSLQLGELALVTGVSPQHLSRLFQSAFGMTPMHMLGLMRLQVALALLSQSALSLNMIAERCGFESPFYFSRCFKKHFGNAPSTVRKILLEGKPAPQMPLPFDLMPRIYW